MRIAVATALAVSGLMAAVPANAQDGDASVGSYLCQFANKCDSATSAPADPAASTPSSSPTVRTSQTRGFRLGGGAPAVTPPPVAAPATRPTRYAVRRPTPAPGATRRVNLMLNFEYNSDAMTPAAQAKAKVFAQALMTPELRDKRFLIEGHTDARGSRAVNLDLSRRRAKSVADFLIGQGVNPRQVDVRGVGSAVPLPGQPADAEVNRRVEAVLL